MNLTKRKQLASKVLGVGKNKIIFDESSLPEIKEAITKQDIRDMYAEGIIRIRETRGRRHKQKRKTRRGFGKIKFRVRNKKKVYIRTVRKLRAYLNELRLQGKITDIRHKELRRKVKTSAFKNKAHLKEHMEATK